MMVCPNCRLNSPSGTWTCDCGYDFREHRLPPKQPYADHMRWIVLSLLYVFTVPLGVWLFWHNVIPAAGEAFVRGDSVPPTAASSAERIAAAFCLFPCCFIPLPYSFYANIVFWSFVPAWCVHLLLRMYRRTGSPHA